LLIQRLATLGKTIFVSSHILYEVQQVCNRVAILQKGRLLKQGSVQDLVRQGEQIVVRLNTPNETQAAFLTLQKAREGIATWMHGVNVDRSDQAKPVLRIDAPIARSSEITAILAQRNLFLAEMQPAQASLEEIFLELTAAPQGTHRGMAALSGAPVQ
jgi:ABC-2 type transport system ATP-binding protein